MVAEPSVKIANGNVLCDVIASIEFYNNYISYNSTRPRLNRRISADELVAAAVNREQMARMLRVGFDLLPEGGNVNIDCTRRRGPVIAPYLIEKPAAGQGYASMLDEVAQQFVFQRQDGQRRSIS